MTLVYADMTAFEKQVAEYLTQLGLFWKFEGVLPKC